MLHNTFSTSKFVAFIFDEFAPSSSFKRNLYDSLFEGNMISYDFFDKLFFQDDDKKALKDLIDIIMANLEYTQLSLYKQIKDCKNLSEVSKEIRDDDELNLFVAPLTINIRLDFYKKISVHVIDKTGEIANDDVKRFFIEAFDNYTAVLMGQDEIIANLQL